MIASYGLEGGRLAGPDAPLLRSVWIDLLSPTPAEEAEVEELVGLDVPTRADMEEIEASSRLYFEDHAAVMTAILPAHADGDDPEMAPVSFVLTQDRLVTVRYHEPRSFGTFVARAQKGGIEAEDGMGLLVALLEVIVDRMADIVERAATEVDGISRRIFRNPKSAGRDYQTILEEIGRKGDLISNVMDSLLTLERLDRFLAHVTVQKSSAKDMRGRVKTLARDIQSLIDHGNFVAAKVTFLLDATLGMISIEQNKINKILSVVAAVFLPPTLIASIYGMNFEHMPELSWPFGYPLALILMVCTAAGTFLFFKRKGWL